MQNKHEAKTGTGPLAFDDESKGFVIIEYKKDRNFSVVDQGMAYLKFLLKN
jgi:hypothetical protein